MVGVLILHYRATIFIKDYGNNKLKMPKQSIIDRPDGTAILKAIVEGKNRSSELEELFPTKRRQGQRVGEGSLAGKSNPTAAIAMKIRPLIDLGILQREGITNGAKVDVNWITWANRIYTTNIEDPVEYYQKGETEHHEGLIVLSRELENYIKNIFKNETNQKITINQIEKHFIKAIVFVWERGGFDKLKRKEGELLADIVDEEYRKNPVIYGPLGFRNLGWEFDLLSPSKGEFKIKKIKN